MLNTAAVVAGLFLLARAASASVRRGCKPRGRNTHSQPAHKEPRPADMRKPSNPPAISRARRPNLANARAADSPTSSTSIANNANMNERICIFRPRLSPLSFSARAPRDVMLFVALRVVALHYVVLRTHSDRADLLRPPRVAAYFPRLASTEIRVGLNSLGIRSRQHFRELVHVPTLQSRI